LTVQSSEQGYIATIDDYLQGQMKVGLPVHSGGDGSSFIETPWGQLVFSSVAQLADGTFLALEGKNRTAKVVLQPVE